MAQPWTFAGEPGAGASLVRAVTVLEGSTFCISDDVGDVTEAARTHGLFVRDTRVVSCWVLMVDGMRLTPLSVEQDEPFAATFISRVPPRAGLADSTLLVVRRRYVGGGMREDVAVRNTAGSPVTVDLELDVDGDFADLFEVKDGRSASGAAAGEVRSSVSEEGWLRLEHRRSQHEQTVTVAAGGDPTASPGALRWRVELGPWAEWTAAVEVVPGVGGVPMRLRHPRGEPVAHSVPARRLRQWRRDAPMVRTGDAELAATLRRSLEDLGALRIFDPAHPDRAVVAAGAPWFMALFGRDSLLTSTMLVPLDRRLALGTLQTLADHQGRVNDPASEEQPGRILHEIRFGPATDFNLGGRSVYYGTADATPLFVMLVGELRRWGADGSALQALLPAVDRALEWIEGPGDPDGDGFVEYRAATERGLANQGWKDSWDGISFADGRLPDPPIALAEVQGYCYAAFLARAEIAASVGDVDGELRWNDKAEQLKRAFNERFWLPDRGWFALGLDGDENPIDALASNMGHCLWTGVVDDDKAAAVAAHLTSSEMFSGWGIRTLATSMARYNPMSYHNGSVWPHDNALCAAGLMRYGFVAEAQAVATCLLDAAERFDGRLPELFCGFSRQEFAMPVPYPASCSPQAWAAATPVSLLRTLVGVDPRLPDEIVCSPHVPEQYLPLRVDGVHVGDEALSLRVDHDGWSAAGVSAAPIVARHPHPHPRP